MLMTEKESKFMNSDKWLLCPVCKNKTRLKLLAETELKYFPLYCPKCNDVFCVPWSECGNRI